jgi:hypothetical protein
MAAAMAGMMVAGAVMQGIGAMQTAKAQSTAASYNANQATQNAQLSVSQANQDAARFAVQYRRHEGSMVAQFGASGLSAEGTESVLADSASQAKLDEETIKYKGQLRAIGFYNTATLDRYSGTQATNQGQLAAASYILSGVGHAGASYAATGSRLKQGANGSQSTVYEGMESP